MLSSTLVTDDLGVVVDSWRELCRCVVAAARCKIAIQRCVTLLASPVPRRQAPLQQR